MKTTHMVYAILIFGLIVSFTMPRVISVFKDDAVTYETTGQKELSTVKEEVEEAPVEESTKEVAIAQSILEEPKAEEKQEVKEDVKEEVQEVKEVEKAEATTEDSLSQAQLAEKLNRVLKSNLAGTGNLFASLSAQYGIDPYLAVAIVLHETGCSWSCSAAVRNHNNVGGMYAGGSLMHFNSLNEGIEGFFKNLKTRYYDKGWTTAETIGPHYASSTTWVSKINSYMEKIKNA